MRTPQLARRRRARRRVVSLVLSAPGTTIALEEADAWRVALDAAATLQRHFPAFYAAHVASHQATPHAGLGACCALWLLAEQEHGISLRWPAMNAYGYDYDRTLDDDIPPGAAPADLLDFFNGVTPEYLCSLGAYVDAPRPAYLGLNVQSCLAGQVEPPSLLQALIWHLLRETDLSVATGAELDTALATLDEDDRIDLLRIRPLPRETPAREALSLVARDIPEAYGLSSEGLLLRYAVGQTGNPLADAGMGDLLHVYELDGELEPATWDWGQLPELAAAQREANAIQAAWVAWRERVQAEGWPALRRIAAAFHRAARRLRSELGDSRALIYLLGLHEPEGEEVTR